jgi:hypothetical protein
VFLLGLCHGLLYVFIIPPWQHYDEPTQFEYTWLIANRPGLPEPGEFDQGMRREVAASMIEHSFFESLDYRPNLLSQSEPIWIGISQVGERPLYYILVSLPLWLVRGSDITFQLFVGRFVSLILYLVTILAAHGIVAELAPEGHLLRWLVPLSLVLLPGVTDLMTAINDDVGATAFFSLFLWANVILLKRGFSWSILIAALGLALACYWTKNTVIIALALAVVLMGLNLLPRGFRRLVWIPLLAVGLAGLLQIKADEAALWYRKRLQPAPVRSYQASAPAGKYALELVQEPGQPPALLYQLLPRAEVQKLRGKTVTFGAWMWASEPARAQAVGLFDQAELFTTGIELSTQPVFHAMTVTLDPGVEKLEILLQPNVATGEKAVSVYYDGLVLVRGRRPLDAPPVFSDPNGREGSWGDRPFVNLIRNASAERGWIRFRPGVEKFLMTNFPYLSPEITNALIDWPGAGWYYVQTAKIFLETLWGKFGWAHIALAGSQTYRLLGAITLAGILGAGVALARRWHSLPKAALLLMAVVILAVWGTTLFRGISSLSGNTLIPSARYAFPAIIPTMLLLTAGWLELFRPLLRWKASGRVVQVGLFLIFFLALDLLSIWSILQFYG